MSLASLVAMCSVQYRSPPTAGLYTLSLHDALPIFPKQDVDAGAACIVGAFTEALVGPLGPSRKTVRDKERWVSAISEFCSRAVRSEEHTSELQSREKLVCRLLLEKKNLER